MAFNPAPTHSTRCSKLKLKIVLDKTLFLAGEPVRGHLELTCFSNHSVRLGEIAVELNGVEKLAEGVLNSQAFYARRIPFQAERMPPTSAVRGPCQDGYWQANKAKTIFPFEFVLPADAPSSHTFQSIASVKYVVTAFARYEMRNSRDSLLKTSEVKVLERWDQSRLDSLCSSSAHALTTFKAKARFNGDRNEIQLEARLDSPRLLAGSDAFVTGVRVALVRKLVKLHDSICDISVENNLFSLIPGTLIDVAKEETFRDKSHTFEPGMDRQINVNLRVPPGSRTIKKTTLAEVDFAIQISLLTNTLFK
nr:hypothetical protein HK105_005988 [Polyrhizophydium stewartii]